MATEILGGDLKLVSDLSIKSVSPLLLPLRAFAKTAETRDTVAKGDSVQVFVGGAIPDAAEFAEDTNHYETDNGGSHAWKPVTINSHPKSTFSLAPAQLNRLTIQQISDMFSVHAKIVAKKISVDLFTKVTKANFAKYAVVGTAENFDASDVNALETAIVESAGLGDDKHLITNLAYFKALRDDTTLANNAYTGVSDVVREGVIPGVYGLREVVRTSLLPSTGNLVGLVTDTTGLIFGQVIENPIAAAEKVGVSMEGLQFEVAVDPDTGLQLCYSAHFNPRARRFYCTVETWCGSDIGRADGLIRVVSTADA